MSARALRPVEDLIAATTMPRFARFLAASTSRATVHGGDRLPRRGPALVVVNHTSITDAPVVLASLDRSGLRPMAPGARGHGPQCDHAHVRFLATRDVFHHPLIGRLCREAGFIAVDPVGAGRMDAYAEAQTALEDGEIVAIYPEGDVTSPDEGAPRRLRTGAARLALATGVPIVPMAHHDARRIGNGSQNRSLLLAATAIIRRPRIEVVVGETIQPADYAGKAVIDVTRMIRERLTETWVQARDLLAARG